MRHDWQSGAEIRRAVCYDRDTGEQIPDPATWVDEEAGTMECLVTRDGRCSLEVESRRVRVVFTETHEEALAGKALVQKYVEEIRAAREGR